MISKSEALEMEREQMMHKLPGPPRTSQNFADAFDGIEHQLGLLFKQRSQLREEWVKYKCPFKIGDNLIGNDYSFKGRTFVVEEVGITDGYTSAVAYGVKWKWIATGPILNKNGTVGKNYTKHSMAVADEKGKPKW